MKAKNLFLHNPKDKLYKISREKKETMFNKNF